MALMLKSSGLPKIPFIWFWPDGAPGCVIVTHDVEGRTGEDFCDQLMDIDDSFGFKAAFQIIPAKCTEESNAVMEQIRKRGFEVNVHDFNHDGYLFSTRKTFPRTGCPDQPICPEIRKSRVSRRRNVSRAIVV